MICKENVIVSFPMFQCTINHRYCVLNILGGEVCLKDLLQTGGRK